MSTLHVAAMPFPTRQGTQAVVREMCTASALAGRETHLFSYAAGRDEEPLAFQSHRAGDFPRVRSERSGPGVGKLLLDARMLVELAALRRRLSPAVVIAHHVEAAAMAACTGPYVFFAHTDIELELPTYAPARFGPLGTRTLARAGHVLDRTLVRRARAVATISPALAERLAAFSDGTTRVAYVPAPWPVPAPFDDAERAAARRALSLASDAHVVLYAGNLDAYQGLERMFEALALLARDEVRARLLVGTASDPAPLHAMAQRAGIAARVSVHGIEGEGARRALHAAADVVVVPRLSRGGLPMKLLDGLARGAPCVASPTATAGLQLAGIAHVADADDAPALAHALGEVLAHPARRRELSLAGPAYIAEQHSPHRFLEALDAITAGMK